MPRSGSIAVDRLDEAEVRDLAEVVERLAGVAVLDGERAGERHVRARSGVVARRLVTCPRP